MGIYKEERVCAKCGRSVPLSKFGINKQRKDCLQRKCKDCINAQKRKHDEKKIERFWETDFVFKNDRDPRTDIRRMCYSA